MKANELMPCSALLKQWECFDERQSIGHVPGIAPSILDS